MKLYVATYQDRTVHIFAGATELDAQLAASELGRAKNQEVVTFIETNTSVDDLKADVEAALFESMGR